MRQSSNEKRDSSKKIASCKLIDKLDITTPKFQFGRYKNGSVKEILCSDVFQYIPAKLRGAFMDELYRILVKEGKLTIVVPYWTSPRSIQDYRVEWPPLCEQSFLYFSKEWREAQKVNLKLKCNFSFTYGYTVDAQTNARNDETRTFYIRHYNNCVDALHMILTKI
jgi:hypothetical protein